MRKKSTLLLLALIAFGKISFGQASLILHSKQINKFASAVFESFGVDGCIVTDVIAQTGETKQQSNASGKPFSSPFTYVFIQQYDLCNQQFLFYGDGIAWESDYCADNLTSANVDAQVQVLDYVSFNSFPVHVNLNWTSTSPMITHQFSNDHINLRGLHYSALSTGNYRDADASGSVTLGNGPNLTPLPGVFNYIIRGTVADNININFVRPRLAMQGTNSEIAISPNPSTDVLHVTADATHYRIVNMLGAEVGASNVASTSFDINVSNLAKGIYFLRLQNEQGELVKKFVKE